MERLGRRFYDEDMTTIVGDFLAFFKINFGLILLHFIVFQYERVSDRCCWNKCVVVIKFLCAIFSRLFLSECLTFTGEYFNGLRSTPLLGLRKFSARVLHCG